MSIENLIKEMKEYYRECAPYHDEYMSYTDNSNMEKLLAPIIKKLENHIIGKDVLEIACGTGNWTQVLSKRAGKVLAVDFSEPHLTEARKKDYENDNVIFKVADAYTLDGIDGNFNLGFAADFWSHIPKSKIKNFIKTLHSKLLPNSKVIMLDMLSKIEFDKMFSHMDEEGNVIQKRILPNGKEYRVIKNFPTKEELLNCLEDYAVDIDYYEDSELLRWILCYNVK